MLCTWLVTCAAVTAQAETKSNPALDENEDGAARILIEEGIATFVFGRAMERAYLRG